MIIERCFLEPANCQNGIVDFAKSTILFGKIVSPSSYFACRAFFIQKCFWTFYKTLKYKFERTFQRYREENYRVFLGLFYAYMTKFLWNTDNSKSLQLVQKGENFNCLSLTPFSNLY